MLTNDKSSIVDLLKILQYSVDIIHLWSVEMQVLQLILVVVTQNMLDPNREKSKWSSNFLCKSKKHEHFDLILTGQLYAD